MPKLAMVVEPLGPIKNLADIGRRSEVDDVVSPCRAVDIQFRNRTRRPDADVALTIYIHYTRPG